MYLWWRQLENIKEEVDRALMRAIEGLIGLETPEAQFEVKSPIPRFKGQAGKRSFLKPFQRTKRAFRIASLKRALKIRAGEGFESGKEPRLETPPFAQASGAPETTPVVGGSMQIAEGDLQLS